MLLSCIIILKKTIRKIFSHPKLNLFFFLVVPVSLVVCEISDPWEVPFSDFIILCAQYYYYKQTTIDGYIKIMICSCI